MRALTSILDPVILSLAVALGIGLLIDLRETAAYSATHNSNYWGAYRYGTYSDIFIIKGRLASYSLSLRTRRDGRIMNSHCISPWLASIHLIARVSQFVRPGDMIFENRLALSLFDTLFGNWYGDFAVASLQLIHPVRS